MAVAAAAGPDLARVGGAAVVDRPERRGSEGDEEAWVGADGFRHGLAAGESGPDQVVGVSGVEA